jgi:hypothetical protein
MASLAKFFRTELPPHGEAQRIALEFRALLRTPKSNACAKLTARKTMNFSAKLRVATGEPKVPTPDSTAKGGADYGFKVTAVAWVAQKAATFSGTKSSILRVNLTCQRN